MSDMDGSKATALFNWATAQSRTCLLFDYSGCGRSGGDFAEGTLGRWTEEAVALIEALIEGPVVLVGSSMGGWLMLLVGEALHHRIAGLMGIAPAPDFSRWGFTAEQKDELRAGRTIHQANPYGQAPTPTHAAFWQDAEQRRRLQTGVAIDAPVRLLHGQNDAEVPWKISLDLAAVLRSADIQVTLVKDGDHRLSREGDIAVLLRIVAAL